MEERTVTKKRAALEKVRSTFWVVYLKRDKQSRGKKKEGEGPRKCQSITEQSNAKLTRAGKKR